MSKYSIKKIKSFYDDEKKEKDSRLPLFHKKIIRPLSFILTPPFLFFRFSANQVTCLALIFGILGNLNLALGTYRSMNMGVLLILIAIILDFVDGNIARFYQKPNYFGAFLDGSFGFLIHALLPLCLSIGISMNLDNSTFYLLSEKKLIILGSIQSMMYMFSNYLQWRYKAQLLIVKEKALNSGINRNPVKSKMPSNTLRSIMLHIIRYLKILNQEIFIPALALILFKMPLISFMILIYLYTSGFALTSSIIFVKASKNLK